MQVTQESTVPPQGDPPRFGAWQLARIGFATGAVVGILEIIRVFTVLARGRIVRVGVDVVWLAPLVDIVAFTAIGLMIYATGRWFRPLRRPANALGALFAFAVFALMLAIRDVHLLALGLLAAGSGAVLARLVAHRSGFLRGLVRAGVLLLIGTIIGTASFVLLPSTTGGGEQHDPATAEAPDATRPNVLLIILDTVRATSLGLYGQTEPTTPFLDRWSREAIVFEKAIAPAPWTLPTHAAVFTGQHPFRLSASFDTTLDDTYPTLAEVLTEEGYETAGFVGNLLFTNRFTGLARGFERYEDYPVSVGQALLSVEWGRRLAGWSWLRDALDYHELLNRKSAAHLVDRFLTWQNGVGDRPFFAFLNLYDAHEPYLPPEPYDRMFTSRADAHSLREIRHAALLTGGNEAMRPDKWAMGSAEAELDLGLYEGAIAYLDSELSRLVRELSERRILEETLVIITADHGEQFGEHGLYGHINSVYMPLLHVPLIIRSPGRKEGRRVGNPVSLRQIPATVMRELGLEGGPFPGPSLMEAMNRAPPPPFSELVPGLVEQDWYPVADGHLRSLIFDGYHYIWSANREELYDLSVDPHEETDLARDSAHVDLLLRLRMEVDGIVGTDTEGGGSRRTTARNDRRAAPGSP